VQLGDAPPKTLKIPLSGGTAPQAAPGTALLALRTDAAPAAAYPAQGSGVWIDVQRSFGPLQIQRIGFTLSKDGVGVAFDAALSLSALKMAVMGLGVTIPLKAPFVPKFSIDGLDVELKGGAVTIAGGLLKIDKGTYLEFNGELIVKAANFSISAFGSYATTDPPSMFVFVMVNAPLGGPPFFFVTGVSGGFGFNRTLELPPIDEVVSYPFVQGASSGPSNPFGSGSTQNDFLRVMDRYIGVDIGENWLAAGLTFTSFELVDASVVLTVSFGTRVQIGLLGLATLTLPPKDPVPVAMAQMALEAVLAPAEGTLLVAAQLTTNSYVLAKSCQLTGGFAFAMWFPPSDFAGDFVVTLGGYNPYFTPPAHYPKVPRLGINWKIDGAPLVIKGGEYCALTPHSVMAGGGLSATWESGPISAWFNVSADFLIAWAPFHYRIDAGVSFGVRATIDIGITSFTISVSVGANLTIEGPPFSGVAYIDLSVVSFSIAFGNAAKPAKVTWTDFKSFLGGAKPSTTSLASAFAAAPQPLASGDQPAVVRAMVPTGLLRDLSRDKTAPVNYVVDPQHFTLFAQTQIPVVDYAYNGTAGHAPNPGVALGPMNLASFTSTFTMRVQHEHQDYPRLAPQLQLAPAPKALWAIDPDLDKSLNGVPQLPDRLTGFVLVPFIEPRHDMLPIPIAVLLTNVEGRQDGFWGAPAVPSTDPYENDDPTSELVRTIDAASGVRDSLVADLIATGFPLGAVLDTTPLTHRDRLNVLDPVELRLLGENRKLVSSAS
jgi:hypothetical protein